jgi:hypothetical protein
MNKPTRATRPATLLRLALPAALAAASAGPLAAGRAGPGEYVAVPTRPAGVAVQVRLADGSLLNVTLHEDRVRVRTPYGTLAVPLADVTRIDFASRVPADVARRAAGLGSANFRSREEASAALLAMGARAHAALAAAAGSKDAETARRARELLEKVRDGLPQDRQEVRSRDVVYTADSKFTGVLEAETWRVSSAALGEVRLALAELREVRGPDAESDAEGSTALPDPGTLTGLAAEVGRRYAFRVTGALKGAVYGTDVYTVDSDLATAAVHAGVLRVGQAGLVRVKVVAPPAAFIPSTRHGVTSQGWGSYPAYQIIR